MSCKYFSLSVGCLFILLIVSFAETFQFDIVPLTYCKYFIACDTQTIIAKVLKCQGARPHFSSNIQSYIFVLIHFELIFVYDISDEFKYFACWYLIFPVPFIEETLLSLLCLLGGLVENYRHTSEVLQIWFQTTIIKIFLQ